MKISQMAIAITQARVFKKRVALKFWQYRSIVPRLASLYRPLEKSMVWCYRFCLFIFSIQCLYHKPVYSSRHLMKNKFLPFQACWCTLCYQNQPGPNDSHYLRSQFHQQPGCFLPFFLSKISSWLALSVLLRNQTCAICVIQWRAYENLFLIPCSNLHLFLKILFLGDVEKGFIFTKKKWGLNQWQRTVVMNHSDHRFRVTRMVSKKKWFRFGRRQKVHMFAFSSSVGTCVMPTVLRLFPLIFLCSLSWLCQDIHC